MNDSLFDVSRKMSIDGGELFNVWNGDSMIFGASFNPSLFQVGFSCDVSRYVEEEESEIITDKVEVSAIVERGFVVRIDWDVWYSDCDYGVLGVGDGSMAWNDELLPQTLQVLFNHIRVECGTAVCNALQEEWHVKMFIDY